MSLISLIHPSRGRARKSAQNARDWIERAGCKTQIIVSVDRDDDYVQYSIEHNLPVYNRNWPGDSKMVTSNNKSVVEATNRAAIESTGDILIYLSDDFKCPDNWGQLVIKEFEGVTKPMLIKVDDCLQGFHVPVLTIPIMNRALYEKLGYFWHPEYKSMFVDCDLYETVKRIGALKLCPHLKFPHEHHSIGKAENDETYRASERNWEQGRILFSKRKAAGFPV